MDENSEESDHEGEQVTNHSVREVHLGRIRRRKIKHWDSKPLGGCVDVPLLVLQKLLGRMISDNCIHPYRVHINVEGCPFRRRAYKIWP